MILTRILIPIQFLITVAVSFSQTTNPNLQFVHRTSDGGEKYVSRQISILMLRGSYRQMGQQYGQLHDEHIQSMYDRAITTLLIDEGIRSLDSIEQQTGFLYQNYPHKFKQFLTGMSEKSSLTLAQIITLNEFQSLDLLSIDDTTNIKQWQEYCSTVLAWGEYSENGLMSIARNVDVNVASQLYADLLTVLILNPDDGSQSVVSVGYPGQITSVNVLNNAGLFLSENTATYSGDDKRFPNRTSKGITNVDFLLQSGSMQSLEELIRTTPVGYPTILNVADGNTGYAFEENTTAVRRRQDISNGLVVSTNHFVDPVWNIPPPTNQESNSVIRRNNLISRIEELDGSVNPANLRNILDLPLSQGGATTNETLHQIVYQPTTETLWLKIPAHQDWTEITLSQFFPQDVPFENLNNQVFKPINEDGTVDENRVLITDSEGRFGTAGLQLIQNEGSLPSIAAELPNGGKLVDINGERFIEFDEGIIQFGEDFPLRLEQPIEIIGQGIQRIPLDNLNLHDLAQLASSQIDQGLRVILFDKIPVIIHQGILTGQGILEPVLEFDIPSLPLPKLEIPYQNYILELTSKGHVRVPLFGEFILPDNSIASPKLIIPRSKPAWIEITKTGEVSLSGQAVCEFPNGMKTQVELLLDDPLYQLKIVSNDFVIPLISNSADLLPNPQLNGFPTQTTINALNAAEGLIANLHMLYCNFAANTGIVFPENDGQNLELVDPQNGPSTVLSNILQVWLYTVLVNANENLPIDSIVSLISQMQLEAQGAQDILTILANIRTLEQARNAFNELTNSSSKTQLMTSVEEALNHAEEVIIQRAREFESLNNIQTMEAVLRELIRVKAERDLAGLDSSRIMNVAIPQLVKRFSSKFLTELGVANNAFRPVNNPVITDMDRFAALEAMHQIATLMQDAALLGIGSSLDTRIDEALSQLALRVYEHAQEVLDQAEAQQNSSAYIYALEDLIDIITLRSLGLFPDTVALDVIPDEVDLPSLISTMEELLLANTDLTTEELMAKEINDINRLLKIVNAMPESVTFVSPPFQRAYDRLSEKLSQKLTLLDTTQSSHEVILLLEAGIRLTQLSERFQLTSNVLWETVELPRVVIQIQTIASYQSNWNLLKRSITTLIDESKRFTQSTRQNSRRRYLRQANNLLLTTRNVITQLWQNEENRINTNPALAITDMILPGDISVSNAAGSIQYHRLNRYLNGAFRGNIAIPKFDGALHILSSSISSGGSIDLNMYGNASIPQGQILVSPRNPIQFQHRPQSIPTLTGSIQVELNNGMKFLSSLSFVEPNYRFEISAEDIRFNALEPLEGLIDELPEFDGLPDINVLALTDHYLNLNAIQTSLEPVVESINSVPPLLDVEFSFNPIPVDLSLDPILAWANAVLADDELDEPDNSDPPFGDSTPTLTQTAIATKYKNSLQLSFDGTLSIGDNIVTRLVNLNQAMSRFDQALEKLKPSLEAGVLDISQFPGLMKHLKDWGTELDLLITSKATELSHDDALKVIKSITTYRGLLQQLDLNPGEENGLKDFDEALIEFTQTVSDNHLRDWGFDDTTGELTNNEKLYDLNRAELNEIYTEFSDTIVSKSLFGGVPLDKEIKAVGEYKNRDRTLIIEEYRKLQDKDSLTGYQLMDDLQDIAFLAIKTSELFQYSAVGLRIDGTTGAISASSDLADAVKPEKDRILEHLYQQPPITTGIHFNAPDNYFKQSALLLVQIEEAFKEAVNKSIDKHATTILEEIEELTSIPWTDNEIKQGVKALENIVDIVYWLRYRQQTQNPVLNNYITNIRTNLNNLMEKSVSVARDGENWELLGQYQLLIRDAVAVLQPEFLKKALQNNSSGKIVRPLQAEDTEITELRTAFLLSSYTIAQTLKDISDQNIAQRNQANYSPILFELPGDVAINKVFGSVQFNRETNFLQGGFGGQIKFPEINGLLTITEATIDNDTNFSIRGSAEFPVLFNGIGVSINDLFIDYDGTLATNGNGTLHLPNNANISVALAYNQSNNSFMIASTVDSLQLVPGIVLQQGSGNDPLVSVAKLGNRYQGSINARVHFSDTHSVEVSGGMDNNSFLLKTNASVELNDFALFDDFGTLTLDSLRVEYGDHDPNDGMTNSSFSLRGRGTFTTVLNGQETVVQVSVRYRNGQIAFQATVQDLRLKLPGGVIVELDEGTIGLGSQFEGEFRNGRVVYVPGIPVDADGNNANLQLAYLSFNTGNNTLHLDCAPIDENTIYAGSATLPGSMQLELSRLVVNYGGDVPANAPDTPLGFVVDPNNELSFFGDGQISFDDNSILQSESILTAIVSFNTSNALQATLALSGEEVAISEIDARFHQGTVSFSFLADSEQFSLFAFGGFDIGPVVMAVPEEDPLQVLVQGNTLQSISGTALMSSDTFGDVGLTVSYEESQELLVAAYADVQLNNGIRLFQQQGDPVLLLEKQGNQYYFSVSAEVNIPQQGAGVGRILVDGEMQVAATPAGTLQLISFSAQSVTENLNWELPGQIEVEQTIVNIEHEQNEFLFRLAGSVMLAENSTFDLDAQLIVNPNDIEDIEIDSQLTAQNINLFDKAFIFANTIQLSVDTKPLMGVINLAGTAGLFPIAGAIAESDPTLNTSDFHLSLTEVNSTFQISDSGFELVIDSGQLHLPEFFDTGICIETGGGSSIALTPSSPLTLSYQRATQSLDFNGQVNFTNIGYALPGNEEVAISLCSASLEFNGSNLPVLSDVSGGFTFPLPNDVVNVTFDDVEWNLNGFPTGEITLTDNVLLFDDNGFSFTLLGTGVDGCDFSGLRVEEINGLPSIAIEGGIAMTIPADMVSNQNGSEIGAQTCGGLKIIPGELPQLTLDSIGVSGTFRLGGSNGLLVQDAGIELQGLPFVLNPTEENPFSLEITGGVVLPQGPELALDQARFLFEGNPIPRFTIAGLTLAADGEFIDIAEGLPAKLTEAGVSFKNPELPLPELLAPANIELLLGGEIAIPPTNPIITGRLDGLQTSINAQGIPEISISGVGVGIGDLPLGPLQLSGQVYIGGLDNLPDGLFFAGKVGGKFNGAGVIVMLAFNMQGPIGACIDVGAGPAGIPLGQTGFLITGVAGGVSFANTNADPCDFLELIALGGDGRPLSVQNADLLREHPGVYPMSSHQPLQAAITWEELAEQNERYWLLNEYQTSTGETEIYKPVVSSHEPVVTPYKVTPYQEEIPCPSGECPPPTINLLCQLHPDTELYPDKVIVKFSSIDESLLNDIGITRSFIENLGLTTAQEISTEIGQKIRDLVESITPPADPSLVGEDLAFEINMLINEQMNALQEAFQNSMQLGIQEVLGDNNSVYDAIVEIAYAGVRCPDITVKLTGTLSHLSVSSFLSATGGYVVSTAGSAGIIGSVNLIGIPVGTLDAFVAGTDAQGLPNPSICGNVNLALGPLELGKLQAIYECEGCVTGTLSSIANMGECLAGPLIEEIVAKVAPELEGITPNEALALLSPEEATAFMAELFSLPPERITPDLPACFFNLIAQSWDSINPEILICGDVEPKLFGISMGAEVVKLQTQVTKTSMAGGFAFSPSYMLAFVARMVFFPPLDNAAFGFATEVPDPVETLLAGMSGQFNSPDALGQYVAEGFQRSLERTTYTIGYEIAPMGLKLADSEARVVMPNFVNHPAHPQSNWQKPVDRGLPPRRSVIGAALRQDFLQDPTWKGDADDLQNVYPQGSPQRNQLQGLSFREDYFPHGGMIGAARLAIPKAIVDAPPEVLATIFNPETDILTRLSAIAEYINGYLLSTSDVGTLSFYIPAPNPPIFTDENGDPLTPQVMMDAIQSFDSSLIQSSPLYPIDAMFFEGEIEGRLVGIPIARGEMVAEPPNLFRVQTEIPEGSWLQSFIERANLEFEIKKEDVPQRPLEDILGELLTKVQTAIDNNNTSQFDDIFVEFIECLQRDLPKASLAAEIENFRIPPPLNQLIVPAAGSSVNNTSVAMYAFTPQFDPEFEGIGPVANVRRNGGIAFQGNFRFGDLIDIDNAELSVQPQVIGLPRLSGLFNAPNLTVTPQIVLHDIEVLFDSDPEPSEPFLRSSGSLDPFDIGVLSITSLNPQNERISASLELVKGSNNLDIESSLSIDPSKIEMVLFGGNSDIRIYGETQNDPFTFSTEGPWDASVAANTPIQILDPITGEVVLRIANPTSATIQLSGNGTSFAELTATLPPSVSITTYPNRSQNDDRRHTFSLNASANNPPRLMVNTNGDFELSGCIGGALNFNNLPISTLDSNLGGEACILVNNNQLTITGVFGGGALDDVSSGFAQGELTITRNGIQFSASVSLPPIQEGIFRITGLGADQRLNAELSNAGIEIGSARLALEGLSDSLLTVNTFMIGSDGSFEISIETGEINFPGQFRLENSDDNGQVTSGSMKLMRDADGNVNLEIDSPQLVMFPDTNIENRLSLGMFSISPDGRFLYDSGEQELNLPGLITASGELTIGYEPEPLAGSLTIDESPVIFGAVDIGKAVDRTIEITNTGDIPVFLTAASSRPSVFQTSFLGVSLQPNEITELIVRFMPLSQTSFNDEITITSTVNPNQPTRVSVSGIGRAVPKFYSSVSNIAFGSVPAGGGDLETIVIGNSGLAPLVVDSISASAPFTVSNNSFTLQPNETRYINVTFSPTSVNSFNRTLTIVTNDETSPHTIPLSGNGTEVEWVKIREGIDDLNHITMITPLFGYAVGNGNTVLRTTNGGRSWLPYSLNGNFTDFVNGSTNRWVIGGASVIYKSSSFGSFQTVVEDNLSGIVWNSADLWNQNNIVMVGSSGNIAFELTNGSFFRPFSPTTLQLNAVDVQGTHAVAVGINRTILYSPSFGQGWTLNQDNTLFQGLGNTNFNDVKISSTGVAFAVGTQGMVIKSFDSGKNWDFLTPQTRLGIFDLNAVTIDGNNVWIVGDNGTVIYSPDLGNNWEFINLNGALDDFYSVSVINGEVFIVGEDGVVYQKPTSPPTGPLLTLSPGRVDFGTVEVGGISRKPLTITNRGNAALSIDSIQSFRDDYILDTLSIPAIEPGQSQTVYLYYNPQESETTLIDDSNGSIRFNSNDSFSIAVAELRGNASDSAWVEVPRSVDQFGNFMELAYVSESTAYALSSNNGNPLWKTTDGGVTWNNVELPYDHDITSIHFLNENQGWVSGGRDAPFRESIILHTTNGGTSWSMYDTGFDEPVVDVHFPFGGLGYAITETKLLKSSNSGATWTDTSGPATSIPYKKLHNVFSDNVYVSAGGNLYYRQFLNDSWSNPLTLGGTRLINDLFFRLSIVNPGWVGGLGGTFLYTEKASDIPSSLNFESPPVFTSEDIRSFHFVDDDTGWLSAGSSIYRSDDRGANWIEDFNTSGNTVFDVRGISKTSAMAVGFGHRVWKLQTGKESTTPLAVLPNQIEFGTSSVDETTTRNITLRNPSSFALEIQQIRIENQNENGGFSIANDSPSTIQPGESHDIAVEFYGETSGLYNANLTVLSNGSEPEVITSISGEKEKNPSTFVITTNPPNLRVIVDGIAMDAPVIITGWVEGSQHTIEASEVQQSNSSNDLEYQFQSWNTSADSLINFTVSDQNTTFIAQYVPQSFQNTRPVIEAKRVSPVVKPSQVSSPRGAYLSLRNAELSIPSLGGFDVDGEIFLSASYMFANVNAGEIHIPQNQSTPRLVDIGEMSWVFEFKANEYLRLCANNPSISLLNRDIAPSSHLFVELNANGSYDFDFETLETFPLQPGVLAIGPSSVSLTNDVPNTNISFQLNVNGELLALQNLDSEWMIQRSVDFTINDGPFEHRFDNIPDANLGVPFIDTDPGAIVVKRDEDGVFSLGLEDWSINVLGRELTQASGSVNSAGLLELEAAPPDDPFTLGPVELQTTQSTTLALDMNPLHPSLEFRMPPSQILHPEIAGYPNAGISIPGFNFNSQGNFTIRRTIPTFSYGEVQLTQSGNINQSFFELKRSNNQVTMLVKVDDETAYTDHELNLYLSRNTANFTFSGSLKLPNPVTDDDITIGSFSIGYDPDSPNYQFRQSFFDVRNLITDPFDLFKDNYIGLYLGSAGGRVCTLTVIDEDESISFDNLSLSTSSCLNF